MADINTSIKKRPLPGAKGGPDASNTKKPKSGPITAEISVDEVAAAVAKKAKIALKRKERAESKSAASKSVTAAAAVGSDEDVEEEHAAVEMHEGEFAAPVVAGSKSASAAVVVDENEFAAPVSISPGVWQLGVVVKNVDFNVLPIIVPTSRGGTLTTGAVCFGGGVYHTKDTLEKDFACRMVTSDLVREIAQVFNGISGAPHQTSAQLGPYLDNHCKKGSIFHFVSLVGAKAVLGKTDITIDGLIVKMVEKETFKSRYSLNPVPIKTKLLPPVTLVEPKQVLNARYVNFFATAVYTATTDGQGIEAVAAMFPAITTNSNGN